MMNFKRQFLMLQNVWKASVARNSTVVEGSCHAVCQYMSRHCQRKTTGTRHFKSYWHAVLHRQQQQTSLASSNMRPCDIFITVWRWPLTFRHYFLNTVSGCHELPVYQLLCWQLKPFSSHSADTQTDRQTDTQSQAQLITLRPYPRLSYRRRALWYVTN